MKRPIVVFFLFLACARLASSQARPTATRTGDLQIGGGFVADFPDYTKHKFYGYGFYGDFDFIDHLGVEGEFRSATDSIIPQSQKTYEVGPRYFRRYGRFIPYAKALVGHGSEGYPPFSGSTTSAGSAGYNFFGLGTGVDIPLTYHMIVRTDFEYQRWFASTTPGALNDIGGLPRGLTPILYTGGVAWRFGSSDPIPRGRHRDYKP